jgi:SAM-dependent MidA family methyltransferase
VPEPSRSEPPSLPGEEERLARVVEAIRQRAAPDGFVPFDEFQSAALYTTGAGYYDTPGRRLGISGDFYTAAHVSTLFGATIADRIVAEHQRLGRPRRFRVVEMGPGDGALAATIVEELGRALPVDADWEYALVERSTSLRDLVLGRLASSPNSDRVRTATALSADGPFEGVVIANEFLDALPSRRIRWADGTWRELGVRWTERGFGEAEGPLRPILGSELPAASPEGAILEFSPSAEGFARELSDHLVDGAALLLDYGEDESRLLQRHPPGTLQAFRGHRALPDPYDRPGSADLSTFVNFTRLRDVGRALGFAEEFYGSQAEALGRWGFEARFQRALGAAGGAEEEVRLRLAAKNLLFGFDNFRALEWRPGASPAPT